MAGRARKRPKALAPGVEERYPFWPKLRIGIAVVKGTWYATRAIARDFAGGEKRQSLALAYGLRLGQIDDALRYELGTLIRADETHPVSPLDR